MNKFVFLIAFIVLAVLLWATHVQLRYSVATVLFPIVAMALAPIAIHKIVNLYVCIAVMVSLTGFASEPFQKLYGIEGFLEKAVVSAVFFGILWVVGMGWRRSWQPEK